MKARRFIRIMRPSGVMSICRSRAHHKNTIRLQRVKPLHRLCIALCEGQLLCLHGLHTSVHTLPEPHISCICSYSRCERMENNNEVKYFRRTISDSFIRIVMFCFMDDFGTRMFLGILLLRIVFIFYWFGATCYHLLN